MANTTFNWEFRKIMHHFRFEARLAVLMAYVLHANIRGRAWPSVELLCDETGYKKAAVVDAKKWLVKHKAIEKVLYSKRVAEEKELHQRQDIMQITGTVDIDGVEYNYLYINEKSNISLSKILDSEISLSETEGSTNVVKGSQKNTTPTKPNGKKTRKRTARDDMFDAVVEVSKLDPDTAASFVSSTVTLLINAKKTPDHVRRFEKIWYTREFPGGKNDGKAPSPACIAKYIGWVDEAEKAAALPPTASNAARPARRFE